MHKASRRDVGEGEFPGGWRRGSALTWGLKKGLRYVAIAVGVDEGRKIGRLCFPVYLQSAGGDT